MFKRIALLAIASLIFTGAGCSLGGDDKTAPKDTAGVNNIPLNVTDGTQGSGEIVLESPQKDQELKSPFLVAGTADLPGNRAYVRVKNSEGKSVIEAWTAIKKTKDGAGKFSVLINFNFRGTEAGTVEVFGKDSDNAEVGLQSVPVKFDVTSSQAADSSEAEE